ncbi:hypothetical protein ZWY2020_040206 [Hordeum vulgare]|nr:hypothetical protein ZWY2020_040206 [Hordeum vulgare]
MASSSSSRGSSSCRNRRSLDPTIPYREHPMDYEPPIDCECGSKMPRWISWSDDNSGRRYHKCRFRQIGGTRGCDLYYWLDDPTTPYFTRLIVDLRDVVWEKREENKRLMEDPKKDRFEKMEMQKLQEKIDIQATEIKTLKMKI